MKENGNLIKPDCHKVEMVAAKEGDIILLCTDGLTEMVPDDCIKDIFMKDCPTKEKAQLLLEQALEAGGKDNITIILVEVI
jgi:protein phosphatase